MANWLDRRREKIAAEIQRNRVEQHRVPTWFLALVLGAILAGWAAVILLA